jgi:hypothetical protein
MEIKLYAAFGYRKSECERLRFSHIKIYKIKEVVIIFKDIAILLEINSFVGSDKSISPYLQGGLFSRELI